MPRVTRLATRHGWSPGRKSKGPEGPFAWFIDRCASEVRANRSEHRRMVCVALAHGQAGTDVGLQPEDLGARTEGQRAVVLVELHAGHGVRRGIRHRLQLCLGLLVRVLELAVHGEARIRLELLADGV